MVTITRRPAGASSEAVGELEAVVRQELSECREPLEVQFGTWTAEDGRVQYLCRVETPPGAQAQVAAVEPTERVPVPGLCSGVVGGGIRHREPVPGGSIGGSSVDILPRLKVGDSNHIPSPLRR